MDFSGWNSRSSVTVNQEDNKDDDVCDDFQNKSIFDNNETDVDDFHKLNYFDMFPNLYINDENEDD